MTDYSLGDLDELVLLATGILRGDAYAYSIKERLRAEAGRDVALPTVHAALYRLENRGFVTSEMGGATPERGGRRKRLYRLSGSGYAALQAQRRVREQMWHRLSWKPELG